MTRYGTSCPDRFQRSRHSPLSGLSAALIPLKQAVFLFGQIRSKRVIVDDWYPHHDAVRGPFWEPRKKILLIPLPHLVVYKATGRTAHPSGGNAAADCSVRRGADGFAPRAKNPTSSTRTPPTTWYSNLCSPSSGSFTTIAPISAGSPAWMGMGKMRENQGLTVAQA